MNIAVVGGGFTGLTAAYTLCKKGHKVTVFEKESTLGGLAYGFKQPEWDWHLEGSYHHWFTSDRAILALVSELGLNKKLIIKRPVTANLYNGEPYQLDSPIHLLVFPGLSMIDKFRTAALLGYLKLTFFWKPLENITAEQLLTSIGGKNAYKVLWEPLLSGKFGTLAPTVSAAWFWARIKKRTPRLMYMEGGFHTIVTALEKAIKKQGGKVLLHNSSFTMRNSTFDCQKIATRATRALRPPSLGTNTYSGDQRADHRQNILAQYHRPRVSVSGCSCPYQFYGQSALRRPSPDLLRQLPAGRP